MGEGEGFIITDEWGSFKLACLLHCSNRIFSELVLWWIRQLEDYLYSWISRGTCSSAGELHLPVRVEEPLSIWQHTEPRVAFDLLAAAYWQVGTDRHRVAETAFTQCLLAGLSNGIWPEIIAAMWHTRWNVCVLGVSRYAFRNAPAWPWTFQRNTGLGFKSEIVKWDFISAGSILDRRCHRLSFGSISMFFC